MTWVLLKEVLVVTFLGYLVFRLSESVALQFSMASDFYRRRNVWLILTITSFLSPSFWLYCVVATPIMFWAGKKDSNPLALYLLLLHVAPPAQVSIPIGAHGLFDLDNYRLLSLLVLIPAAVRLRRSPGVQHRKAADSMDVLLAGWAILHIAIFIPPDLPNHLILHDSATNMLRRAFLFVIDVLVVYYVASRLVISRRELIDAQATFCVACAVMAVIALFEYARKWLLYADLTALWTGDSGSGFYLLRGTALRAQVSAGHPLALGYLLAVAFGFWLSLKNHVASKTSRIAINILFCSGLMAAYSRGPWIGAFTIYFIFVATSLQSVARILKSLALVGVAFAIIIATPFGNRIVSVLPFMGGAVDSGSVTYRESLISRAWEIVEQQPLFGDQLAYQKMEDLRQGQGIIDLVNTYAEIGVFYGIVGLSLFTFFSLSGCIRAYSSASYNLTIAPELSRIGFNLFACLLGTLLMLASCSFIFGYAKIFYVLAGLANAYGRFATRSTGVDHATSFLRVHSKSGLSQR